MRPHPLAISPSQGWELGQPFLAITDRQESRWELGWLDQIDLSDAFRCMHNKLRSSSRPWPCLPPGSETLENIFGRPGVAVCTLLRRRFQKSRVQKIQTVTPRLSHAGTTAACRVAPLRGCPSGGCETSVAQRAWCKHIMGRLLCP